MQATAGPIVTPPNAPPKPPRKKRTNRTLSNDERPTSTQQRETVAALAAADEAPPLPDDRIGCVVWWSADEIRCRPWALRGALEDVDAARPLTDAGDPIGPEFASLVPAPVGIAAAARRAIARRQRGLPDGLRWYDVGDDARGAVIVALGAEEADANRREWTAEAKCTVAFLADGTIEHPDLDFVDDGEAQAIREMLARYEVERANLTAADVGAILVAIMLKLLNGVRVKSGGGVYFVPRPNDEIVDKLAAAFSQAGVALRRLPAGREMSKAFAGDVSTSIIEEIERLQADATAALSKATAAAAPDDESNRKPKLSAQHRRLTELQALRDRANAYRMLLGSMVVDVDAAAEAAKKATEQVLSLLTAK